MEVSSRADLELPDKLASLDILDGGAGDSGPTVAAPERMLRKRSEDGVADPPHCAVAPDRVLRKRKSSCADESESFNRRVQMKPRKRLASEMSSPKDIEALYLNKKVKTTSQTLETIFEEPADKAESVTLIGGRKIKRHLTFQLGSHFTKEKIKKRRSKIKKLLGNRFLNRKKIPMKVFLQTIECLELDSDIGIQENALD